MNNKVTFILLLIVSLSFTRCFAQSDFGIQADTSEEGYVRNASPRLDTLYPPIRYPRQSLFLAMP